MTLLPPPALASVRVHRLPVHAALSPSAHCWLNIPVNRCAYFMSCWQDLPVHGLLISLVHRDVDCVASGDGLAQVRRLENLPPFPHAAHRFAVVLHKFSPDSCTEKARSRDRGYFLAAKTLALAGRYEHAQAHPHAIAACTIFG